MSVPGLTPTLELTTDNPTFSTLDPASTSKFVEHPVGRICVASAAVQKNTKHHSRWSKKTQCMMTGRLSASQFISGFVFSPQQKKHNNVLGDWLELGNDVWRTSVRQRAFPLVPCFGFFLTDEVRDWSGPRQLTHIILAVIQNNTCRQILKSEKGRTSEAVQRLFMPGQALQCLCLLQIIELTANCKPDAATSLRDVTHMYR
jgi:hypothetical protein